MATIDLASNSALLSVAEKLAEQNQLLSAVAVRGERSFVRYSAYADGTDFTETWSAGQNYIGHAVGHEAPTDKTGYEWSLFASNIRETLTVTLPVDGWSKNTQTFETNMIGENSTVLPTPTPECRDAYLAAGVMITAATETSIIFTCAEVPTMDLVVEVYVTAPMAVVGGGGGLGQSDWNAGEGEPGEILNKPFYDKTVHYGDTVTWDGVPNENSVLIGHQIIESSGMEIEAYFHYLSSSTPTGEELCSGSYVLCNAEGDTTVVIADQGCDEQDGIIFDKAQSGIAIVTEDNYVFNMGDVPVVFPRKGVYVMYMKIVRDGTTSLGYVSSLTIPGYDFVMGELKKLDSKFVHTPDWNAAAGADGEILNRPFYDYNESLGDTLTWDGKLDGENDTSLEGLLGIHYVASNTIDMENTDLSNMVITVTNGTEDTELLISETSPDIDETTGVVAAMIKDVSDVDMMAVFFVPNDNVSFFLFHFPKKGIYVTSNTNDDGSLVYIKSIKAEGYEFYMNYFKSIDPKFIDTPNWDAVEGQAGYIENRPFGNTIGVGDTLMWGVVDTGITTNAMGIDWHQMSDVTPTADELVGSVITMTMEGETNSVELTADNIKTHSDTVLGYNIYMFVASVDGATCTANGASFTFPKAGIYFVRYTGLLTVDALQIPGYEFPSIITQTIDPKYLPSNIYGTSGTVTLAAATWDATALTYTLTVEDLGDKDAIFLSPLTLADRSALEAAEAFISTSGQTVTITVTAVPTTDIQLSYFIARGA